MCALSPVVVHCVIVFVFSVTVSANKDVFTKNLKLLLQQLTEWKIIAANVGDTAYHWYGEISVRNVEFPQADDDGPTA